MSAQEIIAELGKMNAEERQQITDRLRTLASEPAANKPKRDVWEVLLEFAGQAEGLPEDLSVNHDHYLYGTPKREP